MKATVLPKTANTGSWIDNLVHWDSRLYFEPSHDKKFRATRVLSNKLLHTDPFILSNIMKPSGAEN